MDLNHAEVCERLNRIAHLIGRTVGVEMGVGPSGDRLVFTDSNDDPVAFDGDERACATKEEIESGLFLDEFASRALRAASMLKYQEIESSRAP
jgi:hypothetical protein